VYKKHRKTGKNDEIIGNYETRKNMPKVKGEINLFLGLSHKKHEKMKNAQEIQEEARRNSWEIT